MASEDDCHSACNAALVLYKNWNDNALRFPSTSDQDTKQSTSVRSICSRSSRNRHHTYNTSKMALKAFFVLTVALFALSLAQSVENTSARNYQPKKCQIKYQICCEKTEVCGYHEKKVKVPKTCKYSDCKDEKYPVKYKKCVVKYKYKTVCAEEKKRYSRLSVRMYEKPVCKKVKHPYKHCYDETAYKVKKVCKQKERDCSYYKTQKDPKYCRKTKCGEYKYKPFDGKDN